MELDELKSAWQSVSQQLARQSAVNGRLLTVIKLDKTRLYLRPLRWGQIAQIVFGAAFALWGGSFWVAHRDVAHLLIAGILVHGYGILNIVFGALTLGRLARIDYAAPVLDIQRGLALAGRRYVRENVGLGLAWWFLWMPVTMMFLASAFDADLYANAPSVIGLGSAIGVLGLLVTWLFARWAFDPRHPDRAALVREHLAGASLLRAQRQVEEIGRFEAEGVA